MKNSLSQLPHKSLVRTVLYTALFAIARIVTAEEAITTDTSVKGKLERAADNTAAAVNKGADKTKQGLTKAAESTEHGLKTAAEHTDRALHTAADKTEQALQKTGEKIKEVLVGDDQKK